MVFYVMSANGKVIEKITVSPLEPSNYDISETKNQMYNLNETIGKSIGDYRNAANVSNIQLPEMENNNLQSKLPFCFDLDPPDTDDSKEEAASNRKILYMDNTTSTAFDKFLGLHVKLLGNDGESMVLARVKDCKRDRKLIGTSDPNPILNTAVYNVETSDGNIQEYSANVIATVYGIKLTRMDMILTYSTKL